MARSFQFRRARQMGASCPGLRIWFEDLGRLPICLLPSAHACAPPPQSGFLRALINPRILLKALLLGCIGT